MGDVAGEPEPWLTPDEVVWELELQTPPMVVPPEPVEVEVLWDGTWWPGLCDGWRGGQLSVRFDTEVGVTRLRWLPAADVRRRG